jgi:hypothetical protein
MPENEIVRWDSWPCRDEPVGKTALLIAIILITATIAGMVDPVAGPLAAVLLFIILGPYFIRTRYEVSAAGVRKQFPLFNRNRSWDTYKRYVALRDGIFLGTFEQPSRLDSFRGDFLRFTAATDRAAVLALVTAHIALKTKNGGQL